MSESHTEPAHEGGKGGLGKAWESVKKHPYLTAAAVFIGGAVLIYLYYSGGNSSSSNAGQSSGDSSDQSYYQAELQAEALQAQENAQTQQITAAANAQTQQVNGAVSVNTENDQAEVDIAALQADSNNQIASLEAALGTTQSNNALTATDTETTTEGNVDLASIAAQTQQTQIAANTQVTLGAQETGVLTSLLNDVFAQPSDPAYSGTLPQTAGGHSAATTVTNVSNFLNGVPSNSLFTPAQIKTLLNG